MCFIIETGKETALLREKEAKRRFRRAKISGLEELIYTLRLRMATTPGKYSCFLCVSLVLYYPLFIPVINIILFLVFDIFQVVKPRRETRLYYLHSPINVFRVCSMLAGIELHFVDALPKSRQNYDSPKNPLWHTYKNTRSVYVSARH